MWWPDIESWFSWPVLIGVFAAMGTAMLTGAHFTARRIIACFVVGMLVWYSAALIDYRQRAPERDWAYLKPSPLMTSAGLIMLYTVSTGTMRNVRIAVQFAEEHDKGGLGYIYSNGVMGVIVDEGTHLSQVALPPGNFVIDVDPPTKSGMKIRQRLQMTKNEDGIGAAIIVKRKSDNQTLVPPTPEATTFFQRIVVSFYAAGFVIFTAVLAWFSWER
jgi:hypothetical protein